MSIMSILAAGASIFSGFKEIYKNKQELKKMDLEAELEIKKAQNTAKIELAKKQHTNNTEIDKISVNRPGIMDDIMLITVWSPLILLLTVTPIANFIYLATSTPEGVGFYHRDFIPEMVSQSFTSLKELPEYYWYGAGLAYIHVLGMRGFITQLMDKFNPFKGLGKKG